MIRETRTFKSDIAVIGAGIAGCAATVFALARGLNITQIGNSGALAYTSGYLDLLGASDAQYLKNPWHGLAQLRKSEPQHPYARLDDNEIHHAYEEFIQALDEMGIGYSNAGTENHFALLPAGVIKPTFSLPSTMFNVTRAMSSRARVMIVDFSGLQGFSATEIVQNLKAQWPELNAQRITFPDMESGAQMFPEVMARALEVAETRVEFAQRVKAVAGDAQYIALPAILGIHHPDVIHRDIEKLLGLPVFEIPTIPPAVPGIRLRELFEQQLAIRGATIISQQKVQKVELKENDVQLSLEDNYGPIEIEANHIVLASGRFLSGGLKSDQNKVQESLLDLPVHQPHDREHWFSESYFDSQGHAINRAGIEVNDNFQALGQDGNIIDPRVYVAGILLAQQDWIRQRCGAGIAITSAYKAINSIVKNKNAIA